MTRISLKKDHNKAKDEVESLIEALQVQLADQYGCSFQRQGDQIKIKRQGVNGTLTMHEQQVAIDVELGMMTAMLAGPIESAIQEKLDKYLS